MASPSSETILVSLGEDFNLPASQAHSAPGDRGGRASRDFFIDSITIVEPRALAEADRRSRRSRS
jgi:hypothetical protein